MIGSGQLNNHLLTISKGQLCDLLRASGRDGGLWISSDHRCPDTAGQSREETCSELLNVNKSLKSSPGIIALIIDNALLSRNTSPRRDTSWMLGRPSHRRLSPTLSPGETRRVIKRRTLEILRKLKFMCGPKGIKYRKNEVFLDVIESVDLLAGAQGQVLRSEIRGNIKVRHFRVSDIF